MITTKEVKIKTTDNLTSEYIETELKKLGFNILSWAITKRDNDNLIINISYINN